MKENIIDISGHLLSDSMSRLEELIDYYKTEPTSENAENILDLSVWLFEDDEAEFAWIERHGGDSDAYKAVLNQILAEKMASYDEADADSWDHDQYEKHVDD
ncbi:hypothetical protein KDA08_00785 [Candidatus Saccharibacteria bacterium]|jgi:hypothetical protein|nr:hypothetical protein [Candidatus Saccharibacteria bacterium]MCA9312843.1 hypothetical protein [Candidatus Saccharibacteria bacterium]